jgi:lipopolysaccharide heptosyltransferase I
LVSIHLIKHLFNTKPTGLLAVPERILIVRLSAVGDTILSLPILCALRRQFPDSKIAWVVGAGASELLRGHEDLDELFVLSKQSLASAKAYSQFLATIRSWKPDTVIDAQGLTKSAWIARCSGATRRIGLRRSEFEGRELSTWLNNILVAPKHQHVVLRGLELLEPLGIQAPRVEYKVPRDPSVAARVENQLRSSGALDACEDWGIINVGAGWPSKIWPTERYACVAKHLGERWSLRTWVAWGGDQEHRIAQEVVEGSSGWAKMMPATQLAELAEWIRHAKLFVGSDTGPMHLSVAVGTPTVALIGPMPSERVGPLGSEHVTVQRERLTLKQRANRKSDMRPMLSIQVDDVIQGCDAIIQSFRERGTNCGQRDLMLPCESPTTWR